MKLFTDQKITKEDRSSPQRAWVRVKNREFTLPIPDSDDATDWYHPIDMSSIDGEYNLYVVRQEDRQLNWSETGTVVARVGDEQPVDSEYTENHLVGRIRVAGTEHDRWVITKLPTVEYVKP